MGKYNVDLMLAVREQITSHPETHDQSTWAYADSACGTTYCIAGWAAVLDGAELSWASGEGDRLAADFVSVDGEPADTIMRYAESALGLVPAEGAYLFAGDLSREEALARLDDLIEKGKNQP